jgi:hypothetical protein
MDGFGNIIVHVNFGPLGVETKTFELVGGPRLLISYDLLREFPEFLRNLPSEGDEFQLGPYRLKIYSHDYSFTDEECIRIDYPFWWWLVFWHRASRFFRIAKARFIITLAVWRLADHNPASIPSFHDVHIIRRLVGLFHRSVKS